jgi:hypothetical protein
VLLLLLEEAVNLEPVGPPPVPGSRLGHAHHEALPQPAGLAGSAVLLVHHAPVVVLALGNDRLVVASPAKEGLAALAGEGPEVEAGRGLLAHTAQLVLHWIKLVHLQRKMTILYVYITFLHNISRRSIS